jgi:RNA polymerase sigma-70 factor, ECF subfamily
VRVLQDGSANLLNPRFPAPATLEVIHFQRTDAEPVTPFSGRTMEPEQEKWVSELEKLRPLLVLLARQNVHPRLWKDVDPSGVVQDTLVEAHKSRGQFQGDGPVTLKGWVRGILLNNLRDAIRKVHRGMRDVNREVPMAAAIAESTGRLESQLAGRDPSPSEIAMKSEDLVGLASALERLESAQRDAVELHHLQGRSLSETALLLGRSESAAAALLHRGLKKLKEHLKKG